MNMHLNRTAFTLSLLLLPFFAPLPAAVAATPVEEARFVAVVRKAFDEHKSATLVELTCWDRVSEKTKKEAEGMYADLVNQKDVVWDFKLVDPDPKAVEKERTEPGVAGRANIAIIKQLDMKFSDKDGKRVLGIIGFAVGEKDGKLLMARQAPAK
jgi:hypothetical protein